MKNIHILPTDKPSRLGKRKKGNFELDLIRSGHYPVHYYNIYITNDEEIKDEEYGICLNLVREGFKSHQAVFKMDSEQRQAMDELGGQKKAEVLKVILTTDPDLIKDGVQAIDDNFLEWFVKNPSCEFVEVSYGLLKPFKSTEKGYMIHLPDTVALEEPKQIKCYCGHTITCDCGPLEEPKQETLEEAAEKYASYNNDYVPLNFGNHDFNEGYKKSFIQGAKWQSERMYSEEDMISFAEFVATYTDKNKNVHGQMLHTKSKYDGAERTVDLLEQFKKK